MPREPEISYVQVFKDGRSRVTYVERCACKASLMVTIVSHDRTENVRAYFNAWRIFHNGPDCGEVPSK